MIWYGISRDKALCLVLTINDDAGWKAVQEFAKAEFKVEDMSRHYIGFKDLNEYHVNCVREQQEKLEKIPNTSNKIKQIKLKIR